MNPSSKYICEMDGLEPFELQLLYLSLTPVILPRMRSIGSLPLSVLAAACFLLQTELPPDLQE